MSKNCVNVGLIGFGTIGAGVVKLFSRSAELINRKSGVKVALKKICDIDIKKSRGIKVPKSMLTTKAADVLNDPEIDIVIELIGGYKPAYDFVMAAIKNKKHVVTANKALISKYWAELKSACMKNSVEIMAEASVGGGIPILRGIDKGLAANRIKKITGILNGTCNYILTRMSLEKMDFGAALKEAQKKGFAEADPTLDIEGYDAMHKIIVLSNLSFGANVREKDVYVRGIKDTNAVDILYADELGYVMKLLSVAELDDKGINVRVHPAFVEKSRLLASVNYEYNAVYVKGDAVGETMFYGKGAGEMPTASAVLSDVIYLARNISGEKKPRFKSAAGKGAAVRIKKLDDVRSKFYLRFSVADNAGVLASIAGILGKNNISIESVIQKARHAHEKVPVVIMTYEAREADMKRALKKIDSLEVVKQKTVFYRVV
ncbi:MAG TPA: homoserine dehydrogenase [bacterium]|nr:homoserine dehydrogenase [bacterium]